MVLHEKVSAEGNHDNDEFDSVAVGASCRRKLNLRICPIMALALWCSWLEKLNVGLALPGIKESLGITDEQAGFAVSAFFITYPIFMMPSVLLAKRLGPRLGLALMLASFGIIGMLQSTARTLGELVVLRLALGVCEAGFLPFSTYCVSIYYGERNIGFALSQINSIQLFLGIFSGPFGALVLYLSRNSVSMKPWQWLFVIEGIPSVLVGGLIFLLVPAGPSACSSFLSSSEHKWLMKQIEDSNAERERRGMRLSSSSTMTKAGRGPTPLMNTMYAIGSLLCDFRVVLCAVTLFAQATSYFGYYFYVPVLLNRTGSSLALISLLDAIPTTLSIGVSLCTGWVSDKFRKRLPLLIGFVLTTTVGLMLTALLVNNGAGFAAQFTALSVAGVGGQGGFLPIFQAYQTDFLPPDKSAMGLAVINAFGSVGGVAGPNLVGSIRDASGGFSVPLVVMGAIHLSQVAFLLILAAFGRRSRRLELNTSDSELVELS